MLYKPAILKKIQSLVPLKTLLVSIIIKGVLFPFFYLHVTQIEKFKMNVQALLVKEVISPLREHYDLS